MNIAVYWHGRDRMNSTFLYALSTSVFHVSVGLRSCTVLLVSSSPSLLISSPLLLSPLACRCPFSKPATACCGYLPQKGDRTRRSAWSTTSCPDSEYWPTKQHLVASSMRACAGTTWIKRWKRLRFCGLRKTTDNGEKRTILSYLLSKYINGAAVLLLHIFQY